MKTNYTFLLFSLLVMVYSCAKETAEIIPPDPEIDTWVLAQEYNQNLSSVSEGWIVKYQQKEESEVYTVYMKFNTDNTMSILSDYPAMEYLKEQTHVNYSLTGFLNTELTLDTYCVWHKMYDDFGGPYKFIITRQANGNYLLQPKDQTVPQNYELVKATPGAMAELEANITKQKEIVKAKDKIRQIRNILIHFTSTEDSCYFSNILLTGEIQMQGAVSFDTDNNLLQVIYRDATKQLITLSENYEITEEGITLENPMSFLGKEVSEFKLKKKEGSHDIEITAAGKGISGQLLHAKTPGVVPYPDIAKHYTTTASWCPLFTCKGEALGPVYRQFNESATYGSFTIFVDYFGYNGWYINGPATNEYSWFYETFSILNEYTVRYTSGGVSRPDTYPDISPLRDLLHQEDGYIVLYKKEKYNDSDLGSIILIDPNSNSNQFIIRVTNRTDNKSFWDSIQWNNVAYAE